MKNYVHNALFSRRKQKTSLRKKCPYSELFWFLFPYSPSLVRMQKNRSQNNYEYGHFLLSVSSITGKIKSMHTIILIGISPDLHDFSAFFTFYSSSDFFFRGFFTKTKSNFRTWIHIVFICCNTWMVFAFKDNTLNGVDIMVYVIGRPIRFQV